MNTFRYFCKACRRNPLIQLLIIAELLASFLLGSVACFILTTNYYDTSYYFDGIEDYWYVNMSAQQYDALRQKGYGAQYPLYYDCTWAQEEVLFTHVVAISQSFAEQYGLEMLQGKWLDAFDATTDTFSVVVTDHFAPYIGHQYQPTWEMDGRYIMPLYTRDGEVVEISVQVKGVTNFSGTRQNISIGPSGVQYNVIGSEVAYILVPDGYDGFAYADPKNTISDRPITTLIQGPSAEEQAAWVGSGAEVSNVGENIQERYHSERSSNIMFIMVFVGALLLAASTIVTSTAIQLRLRMKENAIAYVCGMTLKQRFVTELARCAIVFLIPFALAGGIIGASLESHALMMEDMTSFWIVAPIIFVVYVLASAASFVIQVKAKPLDGIKEN